MTKEQKSQNKGEIMAAPQDPGPQGLSRRPSRNTAITNFSTEVFDHEVAPSSLVSIVPILRVASEIEPERPRVAYLCMATYFSFPFLFLFLILLYIFCDLVNACDIVM